MTTPPTRHCARSQSGGLDNWTTPECLTTALVAHILPSLPRAPIWEQAPSGGALVRAIEASSHRLFTGDIGAGQDFFSSSPLHLCQVLITNPPFNQHDHFLARVVSLLESPDTA